MHQFIEFGQLVAGQAREHVLIHDVFASAHVIAELTTDVAARDFTTPVRVAAFFENDTHVLRPEGLPIEVTRHLEGDQLIWRFVNFSARLDRLGPPDMEAPGPSS